MPPFSFPNSSVVTDELQITHSQIDIYHSIQIPDLNTFHVEDFFRVPFSHHVEIYSGTHEAKVKKPHENPPIGIVLCKEANREYVEFVIRRPSGL